MLFNVFAKSQNTCLPGFQGKTMEVESSVTTHEHFVRLAHEIWRGWSKNNPAQQKIKNYGC